jgi:hypothetical protein
MFDNTRVDPWNLFIGPSKYVSEFLEELIVDQDFFWRTICTDIYIFNLTRGTRDVDLDGRRNTHHISFGINVMRIKWNYDVTDYLA